MIFCFQKFTFQKSHRDQTLRYALAGTNILQPTCKLSQNYQTISNAKQTRSLEKQEKFSTAKVCIFSCNGALYESFVDFPGYFGKVYRNNLPTLCNLAKPITWMGFRTQNRSGRFIIILYQGTGAFSTNNAFAPKL